MKKKVSKRKKITLLVSLCLIGSFFVYILTCGEIFLYDMLSMLKVNKVATDSITGETYYNELKAKGTIEYTLANDIILTCFLCEEGKDKPFVLICPGGGYTGCEMVGEGYCIGAEINRLGYSCFILRYRTGEECSYHAPLDDVAEAIRFILNNAEEWEVKKAYALCGFSAGGNLIGLFGTTKWGYQNYDLPKPELLIMGYPWLCQTEDHEGNLVYSIYYDTLIGNGRKAFLGENYSQDDIDSMCVPLWIDEKYPSCYIVHGKSDDIVSCEASHTMTASLTENSILYRFEEYDGLNHGFGLGKGTEAEGWIADALSFWENKE